MTIKDIQKILDNGDYGVECLKVTRNIQGTFDIKLDRNIYYVEHEKMENEIRKLGLVNDIYFQEVA